MFNFNFLRNLFRKVTGQTVAKGSAFVKIAEREVQILEAKGKVIAIEAAHKAEHAVLDELQKAAEAVHNESGKIADKLAAVNSLL
jgi:hypothetical protein